MKSHATFLSGTWVSPALPPYLLPPPESQLQRLSPPAVPGHLEGRDVLRRQNDGACPAWLYLLPSTYRVTLCLPASPGNRDNQRVTVKSKWLLGMRRRAASPVLAT